MLVSVIIPAYNTEKFIGKCLDSVCSQTYRNLEILVVNDASTDGTLEIIRDFEANDSRVVLIDQPVNKGNGIGRNTAIRMAKGEYIMFVDSDDTIKNNAIEKLVDSVKTNPTDIVCLGYTIISYDENGNVSNKRDFLPKLNGDENLSFLYKCFLSYQKSINIQCWSNFTRRQLLIENDIFFDESGRHMEDNIYAAKLYLYMKSISAVTDCLYNYTIREGSIMHSYTRQIIEDRINAVLQIKDMLKENGAFEKYKDAYTYFFIISAFMMPFLDCVKMKSPDDDVVKYLKELSKNAVIKNFDFKYLDLPRNTHSKDVRESDYRRTQNWVYLVSHYFEFAYKYYRALYKLGQFFHPTHK